MSPVRRGVEYTREALETTSAGEREASAGRRCIERSRAGCHLSAAKPDLAATKLWTLIWGTNIGSTRAVARACVAHSRAPARKLLVQRDTTTHAASRAPRAPRRHSTASTPCPTAAASRPRAIDLDQTSPIYECARALHRRRAFFEHVDQRTTAVAEAEHPQHRQRAQMAQRRARQWLRRHRQRARQRLPERRARAVHA